MSTTVDEPQTQPSIKLLAQTNPNGEADASIPIRWCVTKQLAEYLEAHKVTNPYLLITVRPYSFVEEGRSKRGNQPRKEYSRETRRYLVPLTQELQYVGFSRPGPNSVTAIVVWNSDNGGKRSMAGALLEKGGHGYARDVFFDYGGDPMAGNDISCKRGPFWYQAELSNVFDELDVMVPEAFFAKDPPQWLQDYLGKFGINRVFDQCALRRRTIPALLVMPIWFALAYALRVIQVLAGGLIGFRGMSLRGFAHPLKYGMLDVLGEAERYKVAWLFKKEGWRKSQPYYLILAWPVITTAAGFVFWVVGSIHVTRNERIVGLIGWEWWQYFLTVAAIQLAAIVGIALIVAIVGIIGLIAGTSYSDRIAGAAKSRWERYTGARKLRRKEAWEKEQKEEAERIRVELEQMICRTSSEAASVQALPQQKQTIRLRAQAAKQKVCKPYASR